MNLFLRIARLSLRQQSTYRAAMVSGLLTNLFFGFLRAAVVIALYGQKQAVNGLSLRGALTMIALSQSLIAFSMIFGSFDLIRTVYNGSITTDLLKPVSLFTYWLARDTGQAIVRLIWRGLFFMLIFSLFYPLSLPERPEQWLALPFVLVGGWMVSFAYRFLVNLAAFWTPDARGIGRTAFTVSQLCSGFIFPLRLLPDWFSKALAFTPFPSMINTFLEVYVGTTRGAAIWQALLAQLFWFAVLTFLSQAIMRAGIKRLVLQGG